MKNLEDLFVDTLKDLYDAEKQMVKALPKMIDQASGKDLKQSFKNHLETTQRQIDRLEQVFKGMDRPVQSKYCAGMEGLIQEGEEMMRVSMDPDVKDAALIASAQKIEHYEISSYGTARAFAKTLGHSSVAKLLDQTGEEEGKTDKQLTSLAESNINLQAQK